MNHILLIDGNLLFVRLFAQLLEQCGYEVEVGHDGRGGIELFRRHPADLVIVHFPVPQSDSRAFIAELRAVSPEVKFIAMALRDSRSHPDPLSQARGLGARHTFFKPFDTGELLEVIAEELTPVELSPDPDDQGNGRIEPGGQCRLLVKGGA